VGKEGSGALLLVRRTNESFLLRRGRESEGKNAYRSGRENTQKSPRKGKTQPYANRDEELKGAKILETTNEGGGKNRYLLPTAQGGKFERY